MIMVWPFWEIIIFHDVSTLTASFYFVTVQRIDGN